jgi:hypothetical protein
VWLKIVAAAANCPSSSSSSFAAAAAASQKLVLVCPAKTPDSDSTPKIVCG